MAMIFYPQDEMSAKRKSYSVEYKKGIVEDSQNKNLTTFCKEKNLDLRLVRKWRAEYDNLSKQVEEGNAKKRKLGSGRQPLFPELEDITYDWIANRRSRALVVRRADIKAFAIAIAPSLDIPLEIFKVSQGWLDNFFQRYELSLRRTTTLFKLEDAEVIKRTLGFKHFVDTIDFSQYNLSNMIAMDETSVYLGQEKKTTVENRGASSIYISSTGYESARVTCVLAIRLDGTKVPPLIIAKGKRNNIQKNSGIYVLETEKAWCTQAVIRQWIDLILPTILRGSQRGLLVWDSASTHRAKDMKQFLNKRRIDQIMIPAGMTSYLQSLDLVINKPFKDYLRIEVNDYIEHRMERNQRGNFIKPNLKEIVNWVNNSWNKITANCVTNALRAGYLDRKCSFDESYIAKHEKFGPRILEEINLQEIQSGIRDLMSYDDVPEEDEMIVLE